MASKSSSGFNLVEAAIVLGVVGLVIGGIWTAAATVNQNLKLATTYKAVITIVERLRQNYKDMNTASLDSTYLEVDPRTFADVEGITVKGTTPYDLWGQPIANYFTTLTYTGTQYSFEFHFNNLSKAVCVQMATRFASLPVTNLRYFSIGSNWHGDEPRPYMPTATECTNNVRLDLYFLK